MCSGPCLSTSMMTDMLRTILLCLTNVTRMRRTYELLQISLSLALPPWPQKLARLTWPVIAHSTTIKSNITRRESTLARPIRLSPTPPTCPIMQPLHSTCEVKMTAPIKDEEVPDVPSGCCLTCPSPRQSKTSTTEQQQELRRREPGIFRDRGPTAYL